MSKRKSLHNDVAAYSASRPLFHALHIASRRAEIQLRKLQQAMNEVKAVHVKLHMDQHVHGVMAERYTENVLEAWKDATHCYSHIFRELQSLTAANPGEGRAEKVGHQEMHDLESSAKAAHTQVRTVLDSWIDQQPVQGKRALEVDDGDVVVSRATKRLRSELLIDQGHQQEQQQQQQHQHQDQQYKQSGDKAAPDTRPAPPIGGNELIKDGHHDQQAKLDTPSEDGGVTIDNAASGPSIVPVHPVDGVEYEDVSAEVEARLKLKEVRRKETKGDMKRKRSLRESLHQESLRSASQQDQALASKRPRFGQVS